jgi:hypothetical protein
MELKVEKDKVLEAAKQCPDAKKVLETLFPDVFSPLKEKFKKISKGDGHFESRDLPRGLIRIRTGSNLAYQGFWLCDKFVWTIKQDDHGSDVLVPTPKKGVSV